MNTMKITRTLIAFLILVFINSPKGWSQITWANTGASTAWYTAANWSPSTASGAWLTSNIAQFANTGTATTAGINMGTASLSIGAIEVTSARTRALTIGSSSTNGSLTLNGTTVNSVSNVILRNNSGFLLTLQDNETGTGKTMNVVLANTSENIIATDGSGGITISSIISGTGRNLTKIGSGSGVLTLSNAANTYSGATTITTGELRLNPSSTTATFASQVVLNGGTLSTTSIATGTTITSSSTLNLTNSSTIALGSNAHSLKFAASNGVSWTSGKTITITGWTGTIGGGSTGTAGKIFVGTSASGLTSTQLCQIQFNISGTNYPCALLSTGELVPVNAPTTTSISPSSATAGGAGFTITVNGTNFVTGVSTVTWGGSARTTTFVSSTQLTATINAADIASAGTATVGVTSGCQNSNTQTFTINPSCSNPTIGTQPTTPQSACLSNTVTYTVAATGSSLTYQWQKSATGSGGWSNVSNGTVATFTYSGATTVSLVVSSSATATEYYQCIVSSGACNTTSSVAQFSAVSSTTSIAPTTTQNLSVSVSGSTLTVTEGSTPSSRQWYYGTVTGGPYTNAISGATSTTYVPNFGSAGSYFVVCKSTYGSPCSATVTSNEVLINVTANTITTNAISGSPFCSGTSVSVPFTYSPAGNFPGGGSCTFSAELSNASGSFSSPTAIGTIVSDASGSQTISATIPGGTTTGTGYRIRVTSNSPAVTGTDNGTNLTINTTVTPSVSIVSSPAAVSGITTICAGTSVTFTATPTNGGASPTYQWKVNGVNTGTGGTTFTTTTLTNGQTVTCDMTSNATCPSSATVTSNTITMTVNALVTPAVSIAITTGTNPLCTGATTVFTATPTNGGASPSYQWKLNGGNVGTNSVTYSNSALANSDTVSCVMTSNATCPSPTTATSNQITITNNTPATPNFSVFTNSVALGQTGVAYTVTNVSGVTYNWSYSGTGATGVTGTTNTISVDYATTASSSGTLSVTASKSGCTSSAATQTITVSASAASDIQFNSGSSASSNTNIDYTLYQGTTLTNTGTGASGSIGVMGFTVRDGGGTTDADALGTDLSAITFSVTNSANIRNARIFNGSSPVGSVVSVSGGNLTFTGLTGLTTTDGGTLALNLRVTFNSTVTDNQKMVFTVTSASTGSSSSTFASGNAGGAVSDNNSGNDINRIEVTATKLTFGTQPSNTTNGATMIPSVTVLGQDANNNTDLDFSTAVTLVCSTPAALTAGAGPVSASGGTATFSGVVHGTDGTYTLTATASGYTSTPTSSSYVISSIPNNSFRTTSAGTWTTTGGTATWEKLISGTWTANAAPSFGSSNNIYIRHAIDITGSASASSVIIQNGGVLTNTSSCTFGGTLLKVETGGQLWVEASLTVAGTFTVQDNADVYLWFAFANPSTSIWAGTENFAPNSNLYIWDWKVTSSSNQPLINGNVTTNTYNGYTAAFGNVYIDLAGSTVADHWEMLGNSYGTTNLCHGNLEILSPNGFDIKFIATAGITATIGIQGNFKLSSGWSSARTVILGTSTATVTVNLKGNLEIDCPGDFSVRASNSPSGGVTLNINGNVIMNGSNTTTNTNFKLNQNSYGTANGALAIVNLKGNLTVGANPTIINLGAIADQQFNFTGTSTQLVNVASAIGTGGTAGVPMFIKNNAKVQLSTNNLVLNNSSTMTVEDGGLLDFGFNGSAPLIISNGGTGTNTFSSAQGSTLKITHQNGIVKNTANDGNVQLSISNKTFNQTATFWYIGKAIQTTGDAITSGSTSKIVIAELANNSLTLTPSNNIAISNGTTLDALGGRLDIRKGIVVETPSATITGSGRLVMTDGTFQSSVLSTTLPQLSNYNNYSLTGGTVELNGNGSQTISGAPSGGYYKVAITNAGTKSVTSAFTISKNLTITNGVFDPTNNAITGNAGLTMTGGTFRMSKIGETLPQLEGIDSVYTITGGTVELYGTSSTQTHSLRGTYNGTPGTNINYYNVELNSTGANVGVGAANVVAQAGFGVAGTMNVNSPACFQLGSGFTITDAGTSTFEVKPGATFKYGGSIATSGATGNVRTDTRTFPTTASYGFVGSITPQDPGAGLPSSMVNMYMDKTNAGDLVTITQDEEMTNSLAFYKGIVKTNSNTMYVSNTSTTAITGGNTSGSDKYVQGRLKRKTNGASTYTFPIGHSTQNAQGFTITPTGTSGSDLLGYLETNSTTPVKTVAYCDLETKTAVGQQIGQGTAGADGALDQIVFNLASPLQWDITNPGGGVSSYNVTVLGNGGQDISPVTSAGGTAVRYLLKNGEPGNTGFATGSGGADYPTVGFLACPNQYTLTGMTSFSKFTLNGANPSGTGLPVKLLFFTGRKVENYSQLDWATAIEIDNDKFIVERSADAIQFEAIGSVKGAGNTTVQQNYQWLDKSPLSGWNYYRLKQVDFDGDVEYTNTVAVNFDGDETTPSIIVFPSPSKDFINVQILGTNQIVEAVLYNMIGQAVKNVTPNERMSIEDLPSGEYFIKVIMGNNVVVKQFVKE